MSEINGFANELGRGTLRAKKNGSLKKRDYYISLILKMGKEHI